MKTAFSPLLPLVALVTPAMALAPATLNLPYNFYDGQEVYINFPAEMVSADQVGEEVKIEGISITEPFHVMSYWKSRSQLALKFSGKIHSLKLYKLTLPPTWTTLKGEQVASPYQEVTLGRVSEVYFNHFSSNKLNKPIIIGINEYQDDQPEPEPERDYNEGYYYRVNSDCDFTLAELAPYLDKAYYHIESKEHQIRDEASPLRPLTVGEALANWDMIGISIQGTQIKNVDKELLEQCQPDEIIPGYWITEPVSLQSGDKKATLCIPELGRRNPTESQFSTREITTIHNPELGFISSSEYLGEGKYQVTLHFRAPIVGDDPKALAELVQWRFSPYQYKKKGEFHAWQKGNSALSIEVDVEESMKHRSAVNHAELGQINIFDELVFNVNTNKENFILDAEPNIPTILKKNITTETVLYEDSATCLSPPRPRIQTNIDLASMQSYHAGSIKLKYQSMDNMKARIVQLDPSAASRVSAIKLYEKLYYRQERGYLAHTDENEQSSIIPAQLLPPSLDSKEITLPAGKQEKELNLGDVDLFPNARNGFFFLELTGRPSAEWLKANPEAKDKVIVNQSLVQLTDLGMMWKKSAHQLYIYGYHLSTGKAIEEGTVCLLDKNGDIISEQPIDGKGVYIDIPSKEVALIQLNSKDDSFLTHAKTNDGYQGRDLSDYIDQSALPITKFFTFSDRELYRPGETVHIKGIIRDLTVNTLSIPQDIDKVELILTRNYSEEVARFYPTIQADSTYSQDIKLPDEETGYYTVKIKITRKGDAEQSSTDQEILKSLPKDTLGYRCDSIINANRTSSININVEHFRRNEFELSSSLKESDEPKEYQLEVQADNFNGTPTAGATAKWSLIAEESNFYPKGYQDYCFGDHRRWDSNIWRVYFQHETAGRTYGLGGSYHSHAESVLDEKGHGSVLLPLKDGGFPRRLLLTASCTVTNGNEQSLMTQKKSERHPAEHYVGIKRPANHSPAGEGKRLELELILVDCDGKPVLNTQELGLHVVRYITKNYRMGAFSRNQVRSFEEKHEVINQQIPILDGKGKISVPLDEAGDYRIFVSGKDNKGQSFCSVVSHVAWAKGDEPWDYSGREYSKILTDKRIYKQGDIAKLLVQSPILGEVMVSVEREKILRQFTCTISEENPVIDVPLLEGDAPDLDVKLFLVQGTNQKRDQRGLPLTEFCSTKIAIDPTEARLKVDLQCPDELLQPGSTCDISGQVLDADGRPVAGASVTLFAEDEGTLQAGGFTIPNPISTFYASRNKLVDSFCSSNQMMGDSEQHNNYGNKGIFIGGGGNGIPLSCASDSFKAKESSGLKDSGLHEVSVLSRSNFTPCAFWLAKVDCDAEGRFTAEVKNPDLITRFKVIAIASAGAEQFGTGEGDYEVSKSVVIEPAAPLAATLGDSIDVPVTLSMNPAILPDELKNKPITWRIHLQGNGQAQAQASEQFITLEGNTPQTTSFKVDMLKTGQAEFTWSVTPVNMDAEGLSDGLSERFTINPPTPYLREAFFAALEPGQEFKLDSILKTPFNGDAKSSLTLSPSPLSGAINSIEILLNYPYLCSEQLSSRLIPLLLADTLYKGMGLKIGTADEKDQLIRKLIIQIRKRCNSAGLISYWPDSRQSSLFNAYVWLTLIKAQQMGYIAINDYNISNTLNIFLRVLQSGPTDKTVNNNVNEIYRIQSSPLLLMVLTEAKMLNSETLMKIVEYRAADKDWQSSQAKWLIALIAKRIQSPAYPAYLSIAQNADEMQSDIYLPSLNNIKLLLAIEENPNSDQLAENMREEARRYTCSVYKSTYETSWFVQVLARYIEQAQLADKRSEINATAISTQEPFVKDKLIIAELEPLKIALDKAYAFGVAEGYTTEEQSPEVVDKGFRISRQYEKLSPDGSWQSNEQFEVGDIVRITISVTNTTGEVGQYVAVEDYVPAGFELVNPSVKGQQLPASISNNSSSCWRWDGAISFKKYLEDRISFFINSFEKGHTVESQYIARVVKSGTMKAPAAKAEMMYKPQIYGLSIPQSMSISPRKP